MHSHFKQGFIKRGKAYGYPDALLENLYKQALPLDVMPYGPDEAADDVAKPMHNFYDTSDHPNPAINVGLGALGGRLVGLGAGWGASHLTKSPKTKRLIQEVGGSMGGLSGALLGSEMAKDKFRQIMEEKGHKSLQEVGDNLAKHMTEQGLSEHFKETFLHHLREKLQ